MSRVSLSSLPLSLRRLFNADMRLQYRTGLIDQENRLTDRGMRTIWAILQEKYAAELTARAKEIVAEDCEEKAECK